MSFGGWLTPPQSAHESRRGSLANSTHADFPVFNAHPAHAMSMPTTPVNMAHHSADPFRQHLSQRLHGQMPSHFAGDQMHDTVVHGSAQPLDCAPVQPYTSPNRVVTANDFEMSIAQASTPDPWAHHGMGPTVDDISCLRPSLFQEGQSMTQEPAYEAQVPPSHALSIDTMAATQQPGFDSVCGFIPSQPQVIVPSQLSPAEDWTMVQYPYTGMQHSQQDVTPGLMSGASSLSSSFDYACPQTPDDNYNLYSEDDGFVLVKSESTGSPSPGDLCFKSQSMRVGKPPYRARRKTSKRGKSNVPRAFWNNTDAQCEVHLEGRFEFDGEGRARAAGSTPAAKPHKCEQCGSSFERSEHLKRHQKTHAPEKEYTCPLPSCQDKAGNRRAISRSDNCTDHFKTHLQGPKKGQRNKHFEWPELRQYIIEEYPPQKAHKMIVNLEKACREEEKLKDQRKWVL